MQGNFDEIHVLVVGAREGFGSNIVKFLLNFDHISVSVLDKQDLKVMTWYKDVEKTGGKVFRGDVLDKSSLRDVTKGIHTIVMALQGKEDMLFQAHMNLLEDAIRNNVRRFVFTDFTLDFDSYQDLLEYRRSFEAELNKSTIKGLFIDFGMLIDSYFRLCEGGICYWGDENAVINLTSQEDAAKFVATAVAGPDRGGHISFSGNELRVSQLPTYFEKAFGRKVELKCLGSLDDLRNKIQELNGKGKIKEASRHMFALHMFDRKENPNNFHQVDFPMVSPVSLDTYLKSHPEIVPF